MEIVLISTSTKEDSGPKMVARYLYENNHKVKIFFRNEKNLKEKCSSAGLIVVSANEETSNLASQIISLLKPLQKPIAYAGIYPGLYPERAIKETDLVIISKPRDTILELANKLENFQRVADIENLWFKATEEQVIRN